MYDQDRVNELTTELLKFVDDWVVTHPHILDREIIHSLAEAIARYVFLRGYGKGQNEPFMSDN